MPKYLPKAVLDRTDEPLKDPWKRLREKPGVKILSIARRSPRER